jgi:hypothetical protein
LLPVSGAELAVREPTGADEIFVVETALTPMPALLELARRVTSTIAASPLDWPSMPATDLDAAALMIRRSWIGDTIRTDAICPGQGCRERIDVSFGVESYIEHHRPRRPRGVTQGPGESWFELAGAAVRFSIPTVADLLEAASASGPAEKLSARCIDAAEISPALARRLDRALAALAPSFDDLLGGSCPACGHEVAMRFDPLSYTLAELRTAFSGIYLETHALATAYGWPEQEILSLPRSRRRRYASIIADERSLL